MAEPKVDFQIRNAFEKRREVASKIRERYGGKVPVILQTRKPEVIIKRHKYLCPEKLTFSEVQETMKMKGGCVTGRFSGIITFKVKSLDGDVDVDAALSIGELHSEYKQDDGFLYVYAE
jgi:hypothetical protein